MAEKSTGYNVVFRYTKAAGGFEGVVTQTPFKSKADFDAWWAARKSDKEEVVEEGVTDERAAELVRSTPVRSYLLSALEKATDPDGDVDIELLGMELANVFIVLRLR